MINARKEYFLANENDSYVYCKSIDRLKIDRENEKYIDFVIFHKGGNLCFTANKETNEIAFGEYVVVNYGSTKIDKENILELMDGISIHRILYYKSESIEHLDRVRIYKMMNPSVLEITADDFNARFCNKNSFGVYQVASEDDIGKEFIVYDKNQKEFLSNGIARLDKYKGFNNWFPVGDDDFKNVLFCKIIKQVIGVINDNR